MRDKPKAISIEGAERLLNLAKGTIARWIAKGECLIPSIMVHNKREFFVHDLLAFADKADQAQEDDIQRQEEVLQTATPIVDVGRKKRLVKKHYLREPKDTRISKSILAKRKVSPLLPGEASLSSAVTASKLGIKEELLMWLLIHDPEKMIPAYDTLSGKRFRPADVNWMAKNSPKNRSDYVGFIITTHEVAALLKVRVKQINLIAPANCGVGKKDLKRFTPNDVNRLYDLLHTE